MAIADVSSIRNPDILVATEPATIGTNARVFGYPIDSKDNWYLRWNIHSNSNLQINQGYQLICSIETKPGMSGGPVIDNVVFIGIHGRVSLINSKATTKRR